MPRSFTPIFAKGTKTSTSAGTGSSEKAVWFAAQRLLMRAEDLGDLASIGHLQQVIAELKSALEMPRDPAAFVPTTQAAKAVGISVRQLRYLKSEGFLLLGIHYLVFSGRDAQRLLTTWNVEAIKLWASIPPEMRAKP